MKNSTTFHLQIVALLVTALTPLLSLAGEAQWGDLTGRFIYDGDPPPAESIRITTDADALGDSIDDESLVVHPENRGVANILVFLLPPRDVKLAIHPSYDATADAKVELAMTKGRFDPHILLLRTSQTMVQVNREKIAYNARINFIDNHPM